MRTKSLFISTFGVLAMSAMTLLSCTKDENEPSGDGNGETPSGEMTAPVLEASASTVTLSADKADENAVTFSWTAAREGEADADVTYALYLNLSSKDIFTEPYSVDLGTELTKSFTNAELNTILVEELGAAVKTAVDIQAIVYATPADGEGLQSNKVAMNITTYEEPVVFPDALVAAGSAIGSNNRALGTEIAKTGEGTYKAEGVRIWTANDAALKFYPDDETSEWCVVAKVSEDYKDMTIEVEYLKAPEGGDIYPSRISGFTFGKYTVEIDLNAGTLALTRTGDIAVSDLELPDELYMRGDALADIQWDWATAKNNPLVKTSEKVYEARNIRLDFGGDGTMGFNVFTGYEADNPMLGMAAESENGNIVIALAATGEDRFRPGTIGYVNGIYNITIDFNTQQMTLTNITEGAMSMMGDANPGGWDTRTILYKLNDHEWEATGVNLTLKAEDGRDLGFKIYTTIDGWWPYYGQIYEDQGDFGIDDFGKMTSIPDQETVDASVAEHDGYDPAFYPSKFGYTSGTYTINVNTETMRVTLTKEE